MAVTAIAVVLPLGLGLWLSTRLSRLATGARDPPAKRRWRWTLPSQGWAVN